ncbi:ArsR/SmtB family transcription factor [Cryptosporangium phraense]|uniref:Helix-turn-helix transcriptional regulator n=1 Tax=Cryptosporangium phraense TaxID=2593070 RepID=A0A545ART5_9ACTN|nr:ArsR family transcriptional regulator [Cryptosporangium phraense]TQS44032.1 helix-turn-helix transcriptional regulator [Cryptosporangium phraense]
MSRTLPEPSVDDLDLTAILGALADPARRTMMTAMYRGPEPFDCSANTWCADLDITPPTVSHHFRMLREAGLTRTVVEGRGRTITVRREDLEKRFPGLLSAVLGRD